MEKKSLWARIKRSLGPGFITGAADDDPSGIATYSQTGAMFGFGQLWVVPLTYPFMTAVQEMCGRIGMVTGRGLAGVIKQRYSKIVLAVSVTLLLIANTINIGADLGAMAASVQLIIPLPFTFLLVVMTAVTLALEIFVPYPTYSKVLKYLTFSLLAYIVTAFVVHLDWLAVAYATVHPHVEFSRSYLLNIAAFLGTTISPYLFFWQADEEVEEEIMHGQLAEAGKGTPKIRESDVTQMRVDTAMGMLFSQVITFFIIITVASTLGGSLTQIETAADAAQALRPFAGDFAFLLFTLGIVGTGLLAVPVLAGSAGYAVAEAMGWKAGLGKKFGQAYGFYGVIAVATIVGLFVNFSSIGSMTMLYYAAMLNGLLAPPLMILLLLISNNKKIMGSHTNSWISNLFGITITAVMSVVALALLWTMVH
ncbi:MAG: putative family Mn2+/Fe2+ transporter [Candidatus Adlerbacteria bacterium]|nr:putative family Mn2+/Fe2+ transporter [Candidatus Adlerbacteria bacterium]